MKGIHCLDHPRPCLLGSWLSKIDWKLLDGQIKTLAEVEEHYRKEGQLTQTSTMVAAADDLAGVYNMLADLWDMKPEEPNNVGTMVVPRNGMVEYGLTEEDGKYNVRSTGPLGVGHTFRNLTMAQCHRAIGECVMSLTYDFGIPVRVYRRARPFTW